MNLQNGVDTQIINSGYFDIIQKDYDLASNSSSNVIESFQSKKIRCLLACNLNTHCMLVIYNSNGMCTLCKIYALTELINSAVGQKTTVYQKFGFTIPGISDGLVNYWPIINDLNDYVGGADLTAGSTGSNGWTADRFNNLNEAIYVSNSYYQAPNEVYFSGAFTIMCWVKPTQLLANSYFMNFGNGAGSDNVYFSLADSVAPPYFGVWKDSNPILTITSSVSLTLNAWQHIAATWDGSRSTIYIDGNITMTSLTSPSQINNITRTQCYFGKSNWPYDPLAYAYFDEIRIYNRALNIDEIQTQMLAT